MTTIGGKMTNVTTFWGESSLLIAEGLYQDKEALFQDAWRALLRSKPELKIRLALAKYKRGQVSLTRAAEIAGVDLEEFKEILREAHITLYIPAVGEEVVRQEVEQLLQLRNRG